MCNKLSDMLYNSDRQR